MDKKHLEQAARLASMGVAKGEGGPFGAVIVQDGVVVGEAHNRVIATNDPTAHAEILAIRAAAARLRSFSLEGCEIYTTCEPCPMCLAAIHWARIEHVYYALTRDDAAEIGFDDARFYEAMQEPLVPLTKVECEAADTAFDAWMADANHTPY